MKPMPAWLVALCRILLLFLIPVALTLTNVRLLMTPLFPIVEYNLPYFPADAYGFSKADRLKWSQVAIDYLLNSAGIDFLGDLRFPEGQTAPPESCVYYTTRDCSYLYNDRELEHMVDVKNVTQAALWVWGITGFLALALAGVLLYFGEGAALRAGVLGGAGVTIVIYVGIIVYIALNFNALFVQFHQVFFESGTWIFLFSDTLIRLFPVVFWRDAFIFIGAASLAEAALLGLLAWHRLP